MTGRSAADVHGPVTCTICLGPPSSPCALPCGHEFCKSCLNRFIAQEHNTHSCPNCRAPFRAMLLPNAGDGKPPCFVCDRLGGDSPAEHICIECDACICGPCVSYHLQHDKFATHHIIGIQQRGGARRDPLTLLTRYELELQMQLHAAKSAMKDHVTATRLRIEEQSRQVQKLFDSHAASILRKLRFLRSHYYKGKTVNDVTADTMASFVNSLPSRPIQMISFTPSDVRAANLGSVTVSDPFPEQNESQTSLKRNTSGPGRSCSTPPVAKPGTRQLTNRSQSQPTPVRPTAPPVAELAPTSERPLRIANGPCEEQRSLASPSPRHPLNPAGSSFKNIPAVSSLATALTSQFTQSTVSRRRHFSS